MTLALSPPSYTELAHNGLESVKPGSRHLLRRFRENADHIREGYLRLSGQVTRGEPVPPVSEWLLDNYYVIEDVVRKIKGHLPWGYYRELPAMPRGSRKGILRVYLLAEAILGRSDGVVTEEDIRSALRTYQHVVSLTIGEVWAIPTMLRLVTIETIRGLTDDILETQRSTCQARAAVAAMRGNRRTEFPPRPSDPFAAAVWDDLRKNGLPVGQAADDLAGWAASCGDDPDAVTQREHTRLAATQITFGNAVTTLRLLDVIDWSAFFEAVNTTEAVLRTDPGGIYLHQDFATRDRCRRVVEELADGSGRPEPDVARAAVAAVRNFPEGSPDRTVMALLLGNNRQTFERSLAYRVRWRGLRHDWARKAPYLIYFGLMAVLSLAILLLIFLQIQTAEWWLISAVIVLGGMTAADLALSFISIIVRRLVPPRVLPKLEWKSAIPEEYGTAVVIPALIGRPEQAAGLLERLELHSLSNPDPALRFALLTDFTDAPSESMPGDEESVAALVDGIKSLNARYEAEGGPRFFLFHRGRLYNPSEGCWMGWERKRGKLDEFNRFLRGAELRSNTTIAPPWNEAARVKFVLTLDVDTVLPREAAKQLIATLAHPLNRPRLSADGRRIEAGYAVLQPRVSFQYRTGFRSWFARLFSGSPGVDPYSSASSDTYMDLFGSGSFTGKGLYAVDAFAATAGRAFPENAILSHDLIESNFARCGLVTDVEVFDEFPEKYTAFVRREHRWTRGDWQLLPWLGRTVPSPRGREPNILPFLERWKVFDNLRRSLLPIATVLLLILGWTVLPGSAWAWTALALAPLLFPAVQQIVGCLLDIVRGESVRVVAARSRFDLVNPVGQSVLKVVFLTDSVVTMADAVIRTLYRMTISRRHLLEWEPAADTSRRLGSGFLPFVRTMAPSILLTGGIAIFLILTALPIAAVPVLLLWFSAPVVSYLVSRPRDLSDPPLKAAEHSELEQIARKTWHFFATFVGPEDHGLPPDNFQEDPLGVVAHRTSPTNIGLYLISTLAAHEFGFVAADEMTTRLDRALDAMEKLKRYHGHFLNWYDTTTLTPLLPAYVSTVDSGNLLACLLVLGRGLRELAEKDGRPDYLTLADRVERIADEMDFRCV
ncbi:MAG TPA: glycosyltransferase family 2 protein, partial [Fimbriiglobus sp.]